MGYITPEYYNDTYNGLDAGNELEKFIQRASDAIDQVTGYKLKQKPFEEWPEFIQGQVKKATATQVEFYVIQGGDAEVNAGQNDIQNVRIGSFQYGTAHDGKGGLGQADSRRVSPNAVSYLEPTGLLYQGLGVMHNVYF